MAKRLERRDALSPSNCSLNLTATAFFRKRQTEKRLSLPDCKTGTRSFRSRMHIGLKIHIFSRSNKPKVVQSVRVLFISRIVKLTVLLVARANLKSFSLFEYCSSVDSKTNSITCSNTPKVVQCVRVLFINRIVKLTVLLVASFLRFESNDRKSHYRLSKPVFIFNAVRR